MDVFSAVMNRRSIRNFLPKDIPENILSRLIDALIWAPSAGNLQSRKFYFIKDDRTKKKIAAAALSQNFIANAPVLVVCCSDFRISLHYGRRGIELYSIQDVAVSVMAMMLVATENKIGTCWVGAFHEAEVSKILDLPDNLRPVALVPVGYPEIIPNPPTRLVAKDIVEFR
jgi:nitroreductase